MTETQHHTPSLVEIGVQRGTDKASHGYLTVYADLFESIRNDAVRLLEIGVGGYEVQDDPAVGGASLRMWRDYFPNGEIVGLDILDKSAVAGDRISSSAEAKLIRGCLSE